MVRNVNLGVRLKLEGGSKLSGELKIATKDLEAVGVAARGTGREAAAAGASFRRAHDRLLRYAGAYLSLNAAIRAVSGAVSAHARQERALALVEARVRATGAAAGHSAGEIAAMAAALQDVTTVGDEEILETQALLLTFNNIADDAFGRATAAALDMSAAIRVDLRSAALQLAKALEDPVRGLSALAESGTTFTESQREMVKSLVEAGRVAEAQAEILGVVESQYQGAARAARDTLGGALSALGNTWGDVLEDFGAAGEAASGLRGLVERLNDALGDFDPRDAAIGIDALAAAAAAAGAYGMTRLTLGVVSLGRQAVVSAAATRTLSGALALLGGPAGALALVAGAAVFLTGRLRDQRPAALDAARGIDEYRLALKDLGEVQRLEETDRLLDDIEELNARRLEIDRLLRGRAGGGQFSRPLRPDRIERLRAEIVDVERDLRRATEQYGALNGLAREGLPAPDPTPSPASGPAPPADAAAEPSGIDGEIERITDRLRGRYLATEEGIRENHRRERFLLQTMYGERSDVVAALEAEYDARIAAIREERARAEAEAAAEHAEALLRSGLPALEALAAGNDALAGSVIRSRSALERERRERELGIQVRDAYAGATDQVVERLVEEHLRTDDLLRSQELQLELLERYGPAMVDYSDRLAAANELLESGALSAGQYARAVAEINIAAGEGGFADGWIAEIERVREASQNAGADIGASFAGAFGPDGALAAGLADSTARMLVFGESSRETFDGVLRQALSGFIAQMIQMGIQWVLLNTVFRATRKTGDASDLARVTAQTQATSFLAAQQAFASTAAIPVVGPALAPGAAAAALVTAQSLGAGAVGATAAKLAAFESGGVVDRPTFFGFGSQRQVGVSGEGGPEAIIPLVRGPSGDLGVRAQGADRDSARPANVNISIQAVDAAGFDELLRERRMQIAGMVREALADEGRSL